VINTYYLIQIFEGNTLITMINQVCKINLKCVLYQEVRISLSIFKTLHVELNYIVFMIFGEIFLLRFSVEKNTLKSLAQSLTFLHQYDENIRCTAYCDIFPKPFVSSNKETRQRIVACIEAICGCYL
jgi:hypothetical protein